ncbi:MAG: deoxyhypusine synthase family protein [Candidatus Hydrothermarchaeaceae archaeon]
MKRYHVDKTMKKERYLKKKIDHIDLEKIKNIEELVKGFQTTSFQSRNIAKCFQVYRKMAEGDVTIFLGLSGATVPGGMKKIIRDMVKYNLIDVLVSTGANLYHDYFESLGSSHYVGSTNVDDNELCSMKIDRIYDTFADDVEFEKTDLLFGDFAGTLEKRNYSTREFFEELGRRISDESSIIKACYDYNVPIFCPTIHDSGIGIGLVVNYIRNKDGFGIDLARDNYEIMQIAKKSKATGVIYLGGGVPKNYIQQIDPMLAVCGYNSLGHNYAIQITQDSPKGGGLSGCTFSEAKSWGKIENISNTATVYTDITIALPLLVGAILEDKKCRGRKKRKFVWEEDKLVDITFY